MSKESLLKDLDGWTEVFIVDPITLPLVRAVSKKLRNPLVLTALSFICGISSGILVFFDFFLLASVFFLASIIFDGMDGKLARLINDKRITTIHATFDLLLDVIRNVFVLLILNMKLPDLSFWLMSFLGLLFIYEASYGLRLEIRQRIGIIPTYSMDTLISQYNKILKGGTSANLIKLYLRLFNKTKLVRTYPNPTLVDSEFVLFVLLPLFVFFPYVPQPGIILLAIAFLIPDVVTSLFLTIKLTMSLKT